MAAEQYSVGSALHSMAPTVGLRMSMISHARRHGLLPLLLGLKLSDQTPTRRRAGPAWLGLAWPSSRWHIPCRSSLVLSTIASYTTYYIHYYSTYIHNVPLRPVCNVAWSRALLNLACIRDLVASTPSGGRACGAWGSTVNVLLAYECCCVFCPSEDAPSPDSRAILRLHCPTCSTVASPGRDLLPCRRSYLAANHVALPCPNSAFARFQV
jgi:hypothetical protein